ncbi:YqgE/AlgH family protein [Falsirhodobacter deserti]|uniref:YqgE/AlgH family protein n=1 Tax=Falsirhodobacter deserti TaxID=1365611 RepID=UPI000FE3DF3B|nr:YqgE/AlgH family protein [Falsirhodobacter deserti]
MNLSGAVLIAMPGMGDERFDHSVVLICAHSDDGSMGLIVNKPMDDLHFSALLEQLEIPERPEGRDIRVHLGGPVERGRGFVLHSTDYDSQGATMLIEGGLCMTATLDILQAFARGEGPSRAILALGYSGWGPGQLEDEIARNEWLMLPQAQADLIFAEDAGAKWSSHLRAIGVDPVSLSATAGRA